MSNEVADDYVSSLADLTVNSKPHINMLTMLAEDNMEHAAAIVKAVEKHLEKVSSETKLPVLYLIDSIVKNVAGDYKTLFTQNIASTFCNAFEKVDEKTRANLFKLRQTWNDVIPTKKLYLLDTKVNIIDPAWPITAPPPRIHVNPRFLNANSPSASTSPTPAPAPAPASASASASASVAPVAPVALAPDAAMREQLLLKQKKLIELQQEKLRLELLQTKAQLEEQQKMLEKQTGHLKPFSEKSQKKKLKLDVLQTQAQLEEQKKQLAKQTTDGSTPLRKLMQKFTSKDANRIVNKSSVKKVNNLTSQVTSSKSAVKVTNSQKSDTKTVTPVSKTESPKSSSKIDPVVKPSIGKSGDILLKPFATAELNTSSSSKRSSPTKSKSPKTSSIKTDFQTFKPKPQPITQEKPEPSPADMKTVPTAPPITQPRIAPVSSQLISAARRTRDPRILRRQMEEPQPEPPPKPESPPKKELPQKTIQKGTLEEMKNNLKQLNSINLSKPLMTQQFKSKSKKDKKSSRQSKEDKQRHRRLYQMVQDLKSKKSQGSLKCLSPSLEKHNESGMTKLNDLMPSEHQDERLLSKGINKSKSPAHESIEKKDSFSSSDTKFRTEKSDPKVKVMQQIIPNKELVNASPTSPSLSKDSSSSSDNKVRNEKTDSKVKDVQQIISSREVDKTSSLLSLPPNDSSLSSDKKIRNEKSNSKMKVVQQIMPCKDVDEASSSSLSRSKESLLLINKSKSPVRESVERLDSSLSSDRNFNNDKSDPVVEVVMQQTVIIDEVSPSSPPSSKDSLSSDKKFRNEKSDPKVKVIQQIMSSREVDEPSPSPPPPPVISDKFKEVKPASLSRLRKYVRNREGSESPPITGDVDLRHTLTPLADDHKKEIVGNAAISIEKDVDLRQFPVSPTKKRPSVERTDAPPSKKSKAEMFDELFGNEDVDLRTLPPPSPPPPPVISLSPPPSIPEGKDNGTERSWAKYKQQKPDTFKSPYRYTPLKAPSFKKGQGLLLGSYDKLGRRVLYGQEGYGNLPNLRARGKPYPYKDTDMRHQFGTGSNYEIIIKQAHEQYNSGSLTDNDCMKIVTEVLSMNEKRQVEEAQRLDEEELRKEEAFGELEPISDDEISAYSEDLSVSMNEDTSSLNADDVDLPKGNEDETHHKTVLDNGDDKEEEKPYEPSVTDIDQRRFVDIDESTNKLIRPPTESHSPRSREHQRDDVSETKEPDRKRYHRERERREEHRSSRHEQKLRRRMEGREARMFRKNRYGQAEPEVWESTPPFEVRHPEVRESTSPGEMDHLDHGLYNSPDPQRTVALDKGNFGDGEIGAKVDLPPSALNLHPLRFGNDSKPESHESSNLRQPGPWDSSRPPVPWLRNIPSLMHLPPLMRSSPVEMQRFSGPNRWRAPPPSVVGHRAPFEGDNTIRFNRFTLPPNSGSPRPQTLRPGELPPADPNVLELIAADPTHCINIDGKSKDIRFYGDTAVAMMESDDPREISFQGGQRRIVIDDRDSLMISFNSPYRDMIIDGQPHRVRFGAPTRELYIDGKWYECYFGGPSLSIDISGKMHSVQLEGPPPQVRTGVQRKDLVVGRVRLVVDAKFNFDLYLDPKPQRVDIEGTPIILRFVEALRTLVVNGVSFKSDFGGIPKPFILKGKKHFFRLHALPQDLKPGYLTIVNMEGGRLQSPTPPGALPAPPQIPLSLQTLDIDIGREGSNDAFVLSHPPPSLPVAISPQENENGESTGVSDMLLHPPPNLGQSQNQLPPTPANPLDMLASLLPPAPAARTSSYSYSVESEPNSATTETPTINPAPTTTAVGTSPFLSGEINVSELLQKLKAIGIVSHTANTTDTSPTVKEKPTDANAVIPVDFTKPETLKTKQPGIVMAFYSGIQCSSCGVRFPPEQTMKYSQHLDWHFRQNRRDKDSARMAQSRKWYYDISDWIQFEEIEDLEDRAQSWFESQAGQNSNGAEAEESPGEVPSVAAGESPEDAACEICRDKFEQFYNEEREEWHLRQAIRVDEKLYHPICYQDYRASLDAPIEVSLDESEDTKDDEVTAVENPPPVIEEVVDDDDDDLEVIECEIIQPVFPIEDLTTSDCESVVDTTEEKADPTILEEEMAEEEKDKEVDTTMEIEQSNEQIPSVDKDEGNDTAAEVIVEDKVQEEEGSITTIDVDTVVKNIKQEPLDDEIMDSEMAIKKEREEIDMPETIVDTTHVAVECSIDGNLQFDDSPQIAISAPPRIKINITKQLGTQAVVTKDSKESESDTADNEIPVSTPSLPLSVLNTIVETQQPPPPGEEPGPLHLKPRLLGKKLQDLPQLSKGTELSGLCSIM